VPTYTSTEGALFVQRYLAIKNRPEAIFAASDDLAVGFVHGALAHGILPGRDYLIAGFDGQERGRTLPTGVLTTAALPSEAMGRAAAGFLLSRIAENQTPVRRLTVGCQLIQGDTTRRP
jgi:DNA-binding LacI/PurR family transcriptional regulator